MGSRAISFWNSMGLHDYFWARLVGKFQLRKNVLQMKLLSEEMCTELKAEYVTKMHIILKLEDSTERPSSTPFLIFFECYSLLNMWWLDTCPSVFIYIHQIYYGALTVNILDIKLQKTSNLINKDMEKVCELCQLQGYHSACSKQVYGIIFL